MNHFTPAHEGNFGRYLNEVRRIPELTKDQLSMLVDAYQVCGNLSARNTIIESHLLYVISVAKNYQTQGLELMDLIEEGNIGLIQAVDHYNASMDIPFIIYATFWIRKYISAFVHQYKFCVRIPKSQPQSLVVDSMDMSAAVEEDESPITLDNIVIRQVVYQALDTLSQNESSILRMTYGVGCLQESDYTIAKRLQLSEQRVRQMRELALCKLQYRIDQSIINH